MKILLSLRALAEGLFGLLFLGNVLVQLAKIPGMIGPNSSYSAALIAGTLLGTFISGVLGYFLLRDAVRLVRRVFSKPVA
jgi:hypothetical protein